MIDIIHNSNNLCIFKVNLPENFKLNKYLKIFEKINFSKSRNLKYRHKFKNLKALQEISNDVSLKEFLENSELINNLNKIYNKTNNAKKIFLKNTKLNKLLSFFIKNIILFDVSVEASLMLKNAFILPHVDSPKKIITLMLYLPTDAQNIYNKLCGTYFYEVKKKDSKYFLNPNNIEVTMDNLEEFYNDADLIAKIPFNNNYLYGFVRTSKSWHEVKIVNDDENRRSLNINFYDASYI